MYLGKEIDTINYNQTFLFNDMFPISTIPSETNKTYNEISLCELRYHGMKVKGTLQITGSICPNQRDKKIFEFCLSRWERQGKPKDLKLSLTQITIDLGYENHKRNKDYVESRLALWSSFIIEFRGEYLTKSQIPNLKVKPTSLRIVSSFSSLRIDGDDITISFDQDTYDMLTKGKTVKKYLFTDIKNEYDLRISEFIQIYTKGITTVNMKKKHPYDYYYKSFSLERILDYIGIYQEYNELYVYDDDIRIAKEKVIKRKITESLKNIQKLMSGIDVPVPTYRLIDGMFTIQDFNYPDLKKVKLDGITYIEQM